MTVGQSLFFGTIIWFISLFVPRWLVVVDFRPFGIRFWVRKTDHWAGKL